MPKQHQWQCCQEKRQGRNYAQPARTKSAHQSRRLIADLNASALHTNRSDRQPESLADGVQEPRQVAAVHNPAVRMKCDHQTDKAWLRGWEQRTNASTADFCDTGGAAELAVKALFPLMQGWAHTLQVCPSHHPCIPQPPKICLHPDTIAAVIAPQVGPHMNLSNLI